MKKMLMTILLIVLMSGCFTASWDEATLKVDALGVNKELEGLKISQLADGSFSIEIEKSSVQGQESMVAIMQAIYDAGVKAGRAGVSP